MKAVFVALSLLACTVIAAPAPDALAAREAEVEALEKREAEMHIKRAELFKRTSCQACGWWTGGADACCSVSCIALHGAWHGGYCNDHKVCVCTR